MRAVKRSDDFRCMLAGLSVALLCTAVDASATDLRERRTFAPIERPSSLDEDKVALGRLLFSDPILSRMRTISCSSCHDLNNGGTVRLSRAIADDGKEHGFNAPTIFNVAANYLLGWRGKQKSLEKVNEKVLLDSRLMAADWSLLAARLRDSPLYSSWFRHIYRQAPNRTNVLDALVTFQRSLMTPNSRFDLYLRGDTSALTPSEHRGLGLFMTYGCASCHQGINLGGNMRQMFGLFPDPDEITAPNNVTPLTALSDSSEAKVFRVPSLRNVAVTGPYFHDGRVDNLLNAVSIMAQRQLGQTLATADAEAIVAFLKTLTGEYDGRTLERSTALHQR